MWIYCTASGVPSLYKVIFDPDNELLEGPGLESTLTLLERYVIEAGGWDNLPAEWQEPPRGLYNFLFRARLDNPDLSLQESLHDRIHLQLNALCEEMLPNQPHPVQVIYRITKDEDLAGRMVLLALPKTPNTLYHHIG